MVWLAIGVLAVGVLLALTARRASLLTGGVILLGFGVAVFAVRLIQAGPYPFPRGMDLCAGIGGLLLGSLLVQRGRAEVPGSGVSRLSRVLLGLWPIGFLMGLAAVLHETDEVVILLTDGPAGPTHTRLWVVDHEGAPWVLTGTETGFGRNVAARPRLELDRAGERSCRVARVFRDLPTLRDVSLLRRQKYLAERLAWGVGYPRLFYSEEQLRALQPGGPSEGVSLGSGAAYRLDPCPQVGWPAPGSPARVRYAGPAIPLP